MIGFLEGNLLQMEGLDETDIAKLNERLPDIQNLLLVLQNHQAQINRVMTDLIPIVEKIIAKQRTLP